MSEYLDQAREIWEGMKIAFSDPQRVHAMVVHAPIVLAVLGLLWIAVMMIGSSRSHKLRFAGVVFFFLGGVAAWQAHETGDAARDNFRYADLSDAAAGVLNQHAQLGEFLWIGFIATSALLLLSAVKAKGIRWIAMVLALITSLATAGWVSGVAHLGGQLVYVHGVGVPTSDDNISNLRKPLPTTPDEDEPDAPADETPKALKVTWDEFLSFARDKAFKGEVIVSGKRLGGELKDDYENMPEGLKPPYRVMTEMGDEPKEFYTNQLLDANQPFKDDDGKSGFFGIPTD